MKAFGWMIAIGIILWIFILGALVPWITGMLQNALQVLP